MKADIYFGVVEDRKDPLALGRVRVRVFGLHNVLKDILPTEELQWATPIMGVTNAGTSGLGETPTGMVEGTHVMVMYLDQYKQIPYVIGVLPGVTGSEDINSLDGNIMGDGSLHEAMLRTGLSQAELVPMAGKEWIFDQVMGNLDRFGVTDEYSKNIFTAGICAIGWGECRLDPKNSIEKCYYSDASRLRSIFGAFKDKPDSYVNQFVKSKDRVSFFEEVYGHKTAKGKVLGNRQEGDGAKYAGMGLFQLTGRANFEIVTKILRNKGYDIDLVKEPNLAIEQEYFAIVALAYCESRGVFRNRPTNPSAWFDQLLKDVGQNVGDNYKIKKDAFHQFLGGINTHPFLDNEANTRYRVGEESFLKESEVENIRATQDVQVTNIINTYVNPKLDLNEITESKKEQAEINREKDQENLKERSEFYEKVIEYRNEIAIAQKETKEKIDASLATVELMKDPANTQYQTFKELSEEIEDQGFSNIFGVLDNFSNMFNEFNDLYNEQVNAINDIVNETSAMVDDTLNGLSDSINSSIDSLFDDLGVELSGDVDFITPEIKKQKDELDSIIREKNNQIQADINAKLNIHVFDKVNEIKSTIKNLPNQIPSNLQSLMYKVGLYGVADFLNDHEQLNNIFDSLMDSLRSKVGLSKKQLEALTDERLQNKIYGFCDPNGKYPLRDLVGEPSTNKIARGKLDRTIFDWLARTQKSDVSVAGTMEDDDNASISIPVIAPKGEYPYTHVKQSESGHLSVKDDTPNHEMIGEYHRTGSGYGIDESGNRVTRIVGDDYLIIDNNGVVTIAGRLVLDVADGASITLNNNSTIKINGSCRLDSQSLDLVAETDINLKAGNNINLEANNDINVNALNDFNTNSINKTGFQSGRAFSVKSADTVILDSANDCSILTNANIGVYAEGNSSYVTKGHSSHYTQGNHSVSSKGNLLQYTQSKYTMLAKGNMAIKSESNINQESKGDFVTKSNGILGIESNGNMGIQSNGNMGLNANGNLGVKSSGFVGIEGSGKVSVKGSNTSILASGTVAIDGAETYLQSGRASIAGNVSKITINDVGEIEDDTKKDKSIVITDIEHKPIVFLDLPPIMESFRRPPKPTQYSVSQSNTSISMIEKDLEDV